MDDFGKLQLFHERIAVLKENRDFFVKSSVEFGQSKSEGKPLFSEYNGPDIKTVKAFLLDFRLFVLKGEPINFDSISNLILKLTKDSKIIENVKIGKQGWAKLLDRKKNDRMFGVVKFNNEEIWSERNIDLWLNTEFFHLDQKKGVVIKHIKGTPFGNVSFFLFVHTIQNLSLLLFGFDANVIKVILDEHKNINT